MTSPPLVYLAGPYSLDPEQCTDAAIAVHVELLDAGYPSICPHLSHFSHVRHPRDYEDWMWLDFELIRKCDVLLRLPGPSSGADREVIFAEGLGIPVLLAADYDDAVRTLQESYPLDD